VGWGHEDRRVALSARLAQLLDESLGLDGSMREPVALSQVALPKATLTPRARQRLAAVVGREWVNTDDTSRILHSGGKSYLDLVAMRTGTPRGAPDAIVYPDSHEAVLAVLSVCANERVRSCRSAAARAWSAGWHRSRQPARGDLARPEPPHGRVLRRSPSQTVSVAAGTLAPVLEARWQNSS